MLFNLANMQIIAAVLLLIIFWTFEAVTPFVKNRTHKIKHTLRNLIIGIFNAVVLAFLFIPLLVGLTTWTARTEFGLLHLIDLPIGVSVILAILLQDAWMYLWHRANHRVSFLWRFHKVHHSDPAMDTSTAVRFHTGEILMSIGLRLGVIALLGLSLWQVLLYDLLVLPVIFFHHSNIRFPEKLDSFYRLLFASPAMHRIHHSPKRIETDSNYGSIFSFWDRLANSFQMRKKEVGQVEYGLDEYKGIETEDLSVLMAMPIRKGHPSG